MTIHAPLLIGATGNLRLPGHHPSARTPAATWSTIGHAPAVDADPAGARTIGLPSRQPAPSAVRDPSGPAILASVAYPNVKGLSLVPAMAFEVQRLAQLDDQPSGDRGAATRAYGAPLRHLTGFLGLLEPLDIRI